MYIRFVWPVRHDVCRTHPGFFFASAYARYPRDARDWRVRELQAEIAWFGEHLAVPGRLRIPAGRHGPRWGVCWFRDDAAEHVSRARYVAWLLTDLGVPIEEWRSPRPGTRVWEDRHQIVALPEREPVIRVH